MSILRENEDAVALWMRNEKVIDIRRSIKYNISTIESLPLTNMRNINGWVESLSFTDR